MTVIVLASALRPTQSSNLFSSENAINYCAKYLHYGQALRTLLNLGQGAYVVEINEPSVSAAEK
jgi:hypothetical protein